MALTSQKARKYATFGHLIYFLDIKMTVYDISVLSQLKAVRSAP